MLWFICVRRLARMPQMYYRLVNRFTSVFPFFYMIIFKLNTKFIVGLKITYKTQKSNIMQFIYLCCHKLFFTFVTNTTIVNCPQSSHLSYLSLCEVSTILSFGTIAALMYFQQLPHLALLSYLQHWYIIIYSTLNIGNKSKIYSW